MEVRMKTLEGRAVRLISAAKGAGSEESGAVLVLPLPAVEVGIAPQRMLPGDRTHGMKVLSDAVSGRSLRLELEAPGGATGELRVRRNGSGVTVKAEGGALGPVDGAGGGVERLLVEFPQGHGYQARTVTLRW